MGKKLLVVAVVALTLALFMVACVPAPTGTPTGPAVGVTGTAPGVTGTATPLAGATAAGTGTPAAEMTPSGSPLLETPTP